MKPAPFEYFTPSTIEETIALLEKYGDDAKLLAGGQSLVPMMNFRLVRPQCLIDINKLPNLSSIERVNGQLRIGALTRHRSLERSVLVREANGLAFEATQLIGHPAIRSRGTIGGSISHADPTAELCTLLAVMDGSVVAAGPSGKRDIPWQDFFLSYFTTSLEPTEMCVQITLPVLPPGAGWAFEEFTRRHGDFGIVGVAVVLQSDDRGNCSEARIAIAGAGPTPVRATGAEQLLKGVSLEGRAFEEAGQQAAAEVDPDSDLHASAEYRRQLIKVMTTRALAKAHGRLTKVSRGT